MEANNSENTIPLHNDVPLVLGEGELVYRVTEGKAYLFAIPGENGARYSVHTYLPGDLIIALPPVKNVHFVLTGAYGAAVQPVPCESLEKSELNLAFLHISEILRRGTIAKADYSAELGGEDIASCVRSLARDIAFELNSVRLADLMDDRSVFANRRKSFEKSYRDSLSHIASVMRGKGKEKASSDNNVRSPLVSCMQAVCSYDGIVLTPIAEKEYGDTDAFLLAKDSNIRIRQVVLKDNWWNSDNGALLGWDNDGKPVALIPKKPGVYICLQPQEGTEKIVTEEVAAELRVQACMCYRPLGDEPVSLKKLILYASRRVKRDVSWYCGLGIVGALVGLLIPELTRIFMDSIIPQSAKQMAVQVSLLVLMCMIASVVFEFVKALALSRVQMSSDISIQAAVMDRVLKLPVAFFRESTAGELAEKALAVSEVHKVLFSTVISSVMGFVFSLVYLVQLFRYGKHYVPWALLFCLILIVVSALVMLIKYHWNKRAVAINVRLTGKVFQFINGVNKLVMTSSEKRAFSIWAKLYAEMNQFTYKSGMLDVVHSAFNVFFPIAVNMVFYALFIKSLANPDKNISTGVFLAFLSSYGAFQTALLSSVATLVAAIQIIPQYDLAKTILNAEPEIQENKPSVAKLSGAIDLSHITFRYTAESPLVLDDVSISIKPGEFVAIVGSSGSGKSTLMRILLGFEKQQSGAVFFDNRDLSTVDVGSVRRNMGVVLQNSTVMEGTIFSNIVGSSNLTMDDAWKAAEMAGLAQDINEMPMKMHTMVSAGGGTLSGGQRQRLIIARAVARSPSILIFDEATSALDNKTQVHVNESLESLNVTRIVIAHRISTIIHADHIYVLDKGKIVESGSYDELMEHNGFFAQLAKRQQV